MVAMALLILCSSNLRVGCAYPGRSVRIRFHIVSSSRSLDWNFVPIAQSALEVQSTSRLRTSATTFDMHWPRIYGCAPHS
ncbi:hypothetical protein K438DRAFT_1863951 [Mycena galopus ATCC 62051]|nr:hypothetical protein K438DRAFT_1863951 [Mycena galopus ATCC 62051]